MYYLKPNFKMLRFARFINRMICLNRPSEKKLDFFDMQPK